MSERLSFGVTLQADPPVSRMVETAKLAEDNGFSHVWMWDSHVLWQEVTPIFALMAASTERVRLGPCVTNPATRDPTVIASAMATLNEISGDRMDMGIGRGDSARRVIGKTPVTIERLEWAIRLIRDLAQGREVEYEGTSVQLKWAHGTLPIWVAAYGPKALRLAGRVGDGVVIQLADPYLIEWFLRYVREGAEEAGRRFEDIKVMAAAPAYVTDDIEQARALVRWFPALVSNHVVDLVKRYEPTDLPQELIDYIRAREHYDYQEHGRVGAEHAGFVTDEVVDRFCVLGSVEQCESKLRELQAVGVHHFNIYTAWGSDPEGVIRSFGKGVVPAFR